MPSTAQLSTPPFSFVTSTQIHECGFVHSNLLTVPVIVFSFVRSNGAKEWCADAFPPATSKSAHSVSTGTIRYRKIDVMRLVYRPEGDSGFARLMPALPLASTEFLLFS